MTNVDKAWIRRRLKELRMNQSDLARALSWDRSAVTRLLSGERNLKADEQDRIAQILGLSVEEFSARRNADRAGFDERAQAPFLMEMDVEKNEAIKATQHVDDEDLPDHPIWGSMAGTIKVMPGVDLTAPMEFEWGAKLYNE